MKKLQEVPIIQMSEKEVQEKDPSLNWDTKNIFFFKSEVNGKNLARTSVFLSPKEIDFKNDLIMSCIESWEKVKRGEYLFIHSVAMTNRVNENLYIKNLIPLVEKLGKEKSIPIIYLQIEDNSNFLHAFYKNGFKNTQNDFTDPFSKVHLLLKKDIVL